MDYKPQHSLPLSAAATADGTSNPAMSGSLCFAHPCHDVYDEKTQYIAVPKKHAKVTEDFKLPQEDKVATVPNSQFPKVPEFSKKIRKCCN